MKKIFKILLIVIFNSIFAQNIDSVSFSLLKVNHKANLIPDYDVDPSKFEIEYLDKRRKFFVDFQMGYLENSDDISCLLYTSPSPRD